MAKQSGKKTLSLNKETLQALSANQVAQVDGGNTSWGHYTCGSYQTCNIIWCNPTA